MTDKRTIYLIDGHAFIFRSFFAQQTLATSTGMPTNAIYGFLSSFLKVLESQDVEYVAVAFDSGRPTFRNEIYPEYKANRPEAPEDLVVQIPPILELLDVMRVNHFALKGFEADDLLGTFSLRAKKAGFKVVIVSSDKDTFQLVDDDICVYDPWKEMVYDAERVREKLGVRPEQVKDLLALTGDTTDNIPGVPKVGPKTAASLLERFRTLDEILAAASKSPGDKALARVAEYAELVRLSQKLVAIKTDVAIEADLDDCRRKEPDSAHLLELLQRLEFPSLASRLLKTGTPESDEKDYRTVLTKEQLAELIEELQSSEEFAVDTETTSTDAVAAEIIGLSFSTRPNTGHYIPLAHNALMAPRQLDKSYVFERLRPLLEDPSKRKIGQNIKYDLLVLRGCGIELKNVSFDTMVADYLLRPTHTGHGLDALALQHLGRRTITYKELVPPRSNIRDLRDVDIDRVTDYASEDADMALMLKHKLEPQLKAEELDNLFFELEMPLVPVLADMESRGVKIDSNLLSQMSRELSGELAALEDKIFHLAGEEFNVNSPKQLAHILFDKLGLPKGRKTKTEYSTDQSVLETLAHIHPLPAELLAYRELSKLKSTYVDALPKLVNPRTGRIHTSYNQAVTATGRLSSSDPNLQNIPIRSHIGRKIRQAFIPADGYVLASFDYSQIELRLLAHLSGDDELVRAFQEGTDVHRRTASTIFGVPENEVDGDMRGRGKTINFAVIYGRGPFNLAKDLDIDTKEAKRYIEEYFRKYSGVKRLVEQTYESAALQGAVFTMFGRKRPVPEINSSNRQKSEAAKRAAFNTVVQGTAADIIKLVMIKISDAIKKEQLDAYMILQVHDELVFEVREAQVESAVEMIRPIMEGSVELHVPLLTSVAIGKNWEEAK
ncbi:MAG: DNA polymerase I [Candidatus Coatesbacteria bacterium]|nr:DNA polymerase I [Candidatus Coatesbacteria bacterium]